jgi:ADP-ribose pyrophosphatase YjhB (NUDIX family)
LVTNYSNKHYGFPRGKVNEGEDGVSCAVREVWEEIGIDVAPYINEDCVITYNVRNESKTMYVAIGVPENIKFNPNHITRKEIGRIEWMSVKDLDANKDKDKFALIKMFIPPIKIYIQNYKQKTQNAPNLRSSNNQQKLGPLNVQGDVQRYSKVAVMRRVEERLVNFGRNLETIVGPIDFKCQKDDRQKKSAPKIANYQ